MKTSTIVWIVVAIVIVLGGWYYFGMAPAQPYVAPSNNTGLNGSPDQTNTGQPTVSPVLSVRNDAKLGDFLVAANGMTLYLYTPDTANVSNCYGQCAINWPPYIPVANVPLVSSASVPGLISTTTRTDGSKQLTYKGVPLYYYIKDVNPGDTLGQNVGGIWFVLKP